MVPPFRSPGRLGTNLPDSRSWTSSGECVLGGGGGGWKKRLEPPGGQVWLVLWCPRVVFIASTWSSFFIDAEPVLFFQTQLKPHLQLLSELCHQLCYRFRFQDWGPSPTLLQRLSCGAYCLVILPVYSSISPTRLWPLGERLSLMHHRSPGHSTQSVHRAVLWVGVGWEDDYVNEWMTRMWPNTSVGWCTKNQCDVPLALSTGAQPLKACPHPL